MTKPIDEMTPAEQMRHWMNIVDGEITPAEGCEIQSVEESADRKSVKIIIRRKRDDA